MRAHAIAVCAVTSLIWSSTSQAEPPTAPALSDLAWLEGHWVMEGDGGRAEEIWMAPLDGSMVGSFRWAVPGQMHVLEFLVIEEKDAQVTFRFKHYHKDHRAWEDAPNTYRLVRVDGQQATFENVAWNRKVPQTIVYSSPAADRLVFRGESRDGDGEPLVLEFFRAR